MGDDKMDDEEYTDNMDDYMDYDMKFGMDCDDMSDNDMHDDQID